MLFLSKHFVTTLVHQPTMLFYRNILFYHAVLSKHFVTKFVHLPTMLFYRNILSQNLFTYLPCCFIVTFCLKICSPTYHAVLS